MSNYWAKNKELCNAIPWLDILERCGFVFVKREVIKGFGRDPVSQWVSSFAEGRFFASTGKEYATTELYDTKSGSTSRLQKQEIITEFLAGGDPEAAHMLIKSWNSTVEQEIAKYLPGGFRENSDFQLSLDEEFENDPQIRALVAERVSKALVEVQVERAVRAIEHDSEEGLPGSWSLDDFLTREFPETGYVVEGLVKYGANIHAVAAAKTGKTNLAYNLTKSLADGVPFLGVFETKQIKGRICLMDFELDERQAQEWLNRINISNKQKVEIFSLRGLPNPFRSEESRRELAETLRLLDIEFLILDPFSSIYSGDSNSNTEVKAFLKEVDAFKVLAGVQHMVIAVHAGRAQNKTRGASTLDDHPDALWYMQKEGNKRYFKAVGRDVDIEESEIIFNPDTGEMRFLEFAKKADPLRRMEVEVLRYIATHPGCNASSIDAGVRGGNTYKTAARKSLLAKGAIVEKPGPGGSKVFEVGNPSFDLLAQL
jgi:hypothetical protein